MRHSRLFALAFFPLLSVCTDGTGPNRSLTACEMSNRFAAPGATLYSLDRIDDGPLPQFLRLPGGRRLVAAGQLALDLEGSAYLLAFYEGTDRGRSGFVFGQGTASLADGRTALLVGSDPALTRATVRVDSAGADARVSTVDQPALGDQNIGAHELLFARCP